MKALDAYLNATVDRLPTAEELIDLANELGCKFLVKDGKPSLRGNVSDPAVKGLVRLIAKEPWRSQVIAKTEVITANPPSPPVVEIPQGEVEIPCHECNGTWFVQPSQLEVETLCYLAQCPFRKRCRNS